MSRIKVVVIRLNEESTAMQKRKIKYAAITSKSEPFTPKGCDRKALGSRDGCYLFLNARTTKRLKDQPWPDSGYATFTTRCF